MIVNIMFLYVQDRTVSHTDYRYCLGLALGFFVVVLGGLWGSISCCFLVGWGFFHIAISL